MPSDDHHARGFVFGSRTSVSTAARLFTLPLFLICGSSGVSAADYASASGEELRELSIEDLGNLEISSVSKKAQPLSEASAAIYVITQEDVQRSGATSVPEMLRLAPNLQVGRVNSKTYAISSRGFNGPLANKLLVLIDGRSVYTPLYGGVYWDMQDVLREDLERIEIISGPGATLWGANAMNGVINITTRSSADTQGALLTFGAGNLERSVAGRFGGDLGDNLTYRVYAKGFGRSAATTSTGADAKDGWSMGQGGFRLDWAPDNDVVTVQGDLYRGSEHQPAAIDQDVGGQNLLARWQHHFDTSELQVQAYYDRTRRFDTGGYVLDIYDLDVQHSFKLGSWNDVVWGGGYRINKDHVVNVDAFQIQPVKSKLDLSNVFLQDNLTLTSSLKLTLGAKLEDDPYSGLAVLPSARLAWKVTDNTLLWSAVSRAVRAPTRFDRDVIEKLGALVFLTGGSDFQAEKLTSYELGVRTQPSSQFSFSVSGFYHSYDNLRSIEPTPATVFPLHFANLMDGAVYGMEAWGNYQVTDWWRLSAGFNVQHQNLRFKPTSKDVGGLEQAGNDPDKQFSLHSAMNITPVVTFDAYLRYVDALPKPAVPAYAEVNSRLAWKLSEIVEISVSGFNLLNTGYREFTTSGVNNRMERSFFVETQWRF